MNGTDFRPRRGIAAALCFCGLVLAMAGLCALTAAPVQAGEAADAAAAPAAGPVVKEVLVVGNAMTKTDDIKYAMRTREGTPLDERILDEDYKRLLKLGTFANVEIHQEQLPDGVRLRIVVKEKAILRRVAFRGNKQVSAKTLQKKITSDVGQAYDAGVVNNDVRAIAQWYRDEYYYFTEVKAVTEPFEDGLRLVFEIEERGRVIVKEVLFHGNDSLNREELFKSMATLPRSVWPWGPRGKYERSVFEQDLERLRMLYQTKGHLDVKVAERPFQITAQEAETKWRNQDIIIHIDIDEGPVYQVGKVDFKIQPAEGKAAHTEAELREVVKTVPGEVYNPQEVALDSLRIRDLYGQTGRISTQVRSQRLTEEKGNIADVVYEVRESKPVTIGQVRIAGNELTKEYVIRRDVTMYPGMTYSTAEKERTVQKLNRLGYFERPIQVDVKETEEGRGDVTIDVKERRTGSISGGVGYNSSEGVLGTFRLKEKNFDWRGKPKNLKDLVTLHGMKGGGQYLGFNASVSSSTSNYSVDFLNPWIWNRPLRFGTGVFHNTREWDAYDERRVGAYFLLGRNIFGDRWDLSGTYKIESVDINDMAEWISDDLRDEMGDEIISRGILRLAYDTRDDLYDPSTGWYGYAQQELAGGPFGGDRDFWKSKIEINHWWDFWRDSQKRPHVLFTRAEWAVADAYSRDDKVPLAERLFAGGLGSVRGFSWSSISPQSLSGDAMGGESMTTATVEYLFPIYAENIRGSVFYDIGSVWENSGNWGGDWRSSCGVGLHVKTPLWEVPIGIYYSEVLEKEEYDDRLKSVQILMGAYF